MNKFDEQLIIFFTCFLMTKLLTPERPFFVPGLRLSLQHKENLIKFNSKYWKIQ